jgi:hypothetical protein
MKTEIQEKFDNFHKKEIAIRRISILLAFIPFVVGSAWMFYSYNKVQILNKKYSAIQDKYNTEERNFNDLHIKKQQLEVELMKTYGLSIDRIINLPAKEIIIKNSVAANDVIKKLTNNYTPNDQVIIRYYYKTIDDEKIILSLKSLGYSFEKKNPTENMTSQKTNCIWCGRYVSVKDCKIIALSLIRAGIEIKAIRTFKNSLTDPTYKSKFIEIGGDASLDDKKTPPLTVAQIEKTTNFPWIIDHSGK